MTLSKPACRQLALRHTCTARMPVSLCSKATPHRDDRYLGSNKLLETHPRYFALEHSEQLSNAHCDAGRQRSKVIPFGFPSEPSDLLSESRVASYPLWNPSDRPFWSPSAPILSLREPLGGPYPAILEHPQMPTSGPHLNPCWNPTGWWLAIPRLPLQFAASYFVFRPGVF